MPESGGRVPRILNQGTREAVQWRASYSPLFSQYMSDRGPGWLSRYNDSLQVGRSGDRIPVGGEIFRTRPDRPWGPPSLLPHGYRVFPGSKAAGAWRWSPTPSSAEVNPLNAELNPTCHLLALIGAHHIFHVSRIRVKERVGLYLYSFFVPMQPVLGWTLNIGQKAGHSRSGCGGKKRNTASLREQTTYCPTQPVGALSTRSSPYLWGTVI